MENLSYNLATKVKKVQWTFDSDQRERRIRKKLSEM